jgi:Fur family transcriptional regulator, iron response regulator
LTRTAAAFSNSAVGTTSAIAAERLRRSGIQPSSQRVAVAEFVLETVAHPTAQQVWEAVRSRVPAISRATVYNTLNLFVKKGLLRPLQLGEGRVGFDPNVAPHHHFIDDATGVVHDVPWGDLEVRHVEALRGLEVHEYQVILHGRSAKGSSS